jgi:hypothetical protein
MYLLSSLLTVASVMTAPTIDYCSGRAPPEVSILVQENYPAFRFPKSNDNLDEDIKYNLSHKGSGCLGLATGDFDGDARRDFIIGLTPLTGDKSLVVVALRRKSGWITERLGNESRGIGRSRLYVATGKPGVYTRSPALDGLVTGNDEADSLKCKHHVAVFGATESTGIAFCRLGGRWKYVWVSD